MMWSEVDGGWNGGERTENGTKRGRRMAVYLVYKVLAVVVTELLGTNDAMQIGLHELLDEIDLFEVVERGRAEDVEY